MTKNELINIRAALDKASNWAHSQKDLFQMCDAKKLIEEELNRPSLPEGLEEAAEEYEKKHTFQRYDGGGFTPEYNETLADAFIAGAEWRDRSLNWIRDLVKAAIRRPEEAQAILERIDRMLNKEDEKWNDVLLEFEQIEQDGRTCRTCAYRERWENYVGKVFSYCGAKHSSRTVNGHPRTKVNNKACQMYKEDEK